MNTIKETKLDCEEQIVDQIYHKDVKEKEHIPLVPVLLKSPYEFEFNSVGQYDLAPCTKEAARLDTIQINNTLCSNQFSSSIQLHQHDRAHRNSTKIKIKKKKPKCLKRVTQEHLTDEQKKANHIASEQKRRAKIRIGFEKLVEMVPTLSKEHKSEALILQKSIDHLHQLNRSKSILKSQVRQLQLILGDTPDDSSDEELHYRT